MSLGHHPQTRPIKIENLDPIVTAVDEHEQSALARILSESLAGHGVQPIEAFAHIARLDGYEDLQTTGEGQHGFCRARNNAAASAI